MHNGTHVEISPVSHVFFGIRRPLTVLRIWAVLLFFCLVAPSRCQCAGVTIITHGFSGNADGWVVGLGQRIPGYYTFPGTNVICYEVTASYSGGFVVTSRKLAGGHPTNDSNAEIVI